MEQMEMSLKEYERGLDLFMDQEKTLNRLAFWRTVLLIAAVLFFGSYVAQVNEIDALRAELGPLAPEEREWTVLGYLNEHQVVQHSVFAPDEHSKALVQLIAKLRSFLGEDLTLENQSDQKIDDFLKLAGKKPGNMRIQNSYVQNLTIPVSYSAMALVVFVTSLTSFFYFAYRRRRLAELMGYIRRNLTQLVPEGPSSPAPLQPETFSRGLLADAFWSIASLRDSFRLTKFSGWKAAGTRLGSALLGQRGASPYRLLNNLLAVFLFARLTFLTAQIVLAERGLTINIFSEWSLVVVLLLTPSTALYLANRWFLTKETPDTAELLTDQGEF